jgi:hypothetical protein
VELRLFRNTRLPGEPWQACLAAPFLNVAFAAKIRSFNMDMQAFLAMVSAVEFDGFEEAYFEVDGEVTGTFAEGE